MHISELKEIALKFGDMIVVSNLSNLSTLLEYRNSFIS